MTCPFAATTALWGSIRRHNTLVYFIAAETSRVAISRR
jgi:hypothetical protein